MGSAETTANFPRLQLSRQTWLFSPTDFDHGKLPGRNPRLRPVGFTLLIDGAVNHRGDGGASHRGKATAPRWAKSCLEPMGPCPTGSGGRPNPRRSTSLTKRPRKNSVSLLLFVRGRLSLALGHSRRRGFLGRFFLCHGNLSRCIDVSPPTVGLNPIVRGRI